MKDSYTKINSRLIWFYYLLYVACIQFPLRRKKKNSSKVEVLNTLKDQHPRLISAESIGKLKR